MKTSLKSGVNIGKGTVIASSKLSKLKSLVIVLTGDGKGKRSSAIGIIVRALGWDKTVSLFRFFKGASDSGESRLLARLARIEKLKVVEYPVNGWVKKGDVKYEKAVAEVIAEIKKRPFLIVADELVTAYQLGSVALDDLMNIIKCAKRYNVNCVCTGRGWPKVLDKYADIITKMQKIKHPYDLGGLAKKGIDF
jgi:cob(I)alamin adenosyltransferase